MRNHTRIYLEALGYSDTDFIPSELSGSKANDIHHISCKGAGGDPSGSKDRIENLMAVTREEHLKFGDKIHYMAELYRKHEIFLKFRGVKYSEEYFQRQYEKYSELQSVG